MQLNSFEGPEVGRSQNLELPNGFDDPGRFVFLNPVSLTPGVVYGTKVRIVSGSIDRDIAVNLVGDAYAGGGLASQFGRGVGDA